MFPAAQHWVSSAPINDTAPPVVAETRSKKKCGLHRPEAGVRRPGKKLLSNDHFFFLTEKSRTGA